jgi:polysaccharide pyruvyl transferase WcaK-like protein
MRTCKVYRIALFGHFDSTNLGNESTLQAIIHNIRVFKPKSEISCITTGPEAVAASYQIKAVRITEAFAKFWVPRSIVSKLLRKAFVAFPSEFYRWVKGFAHLYRTDMLIVPGTGLLTDAFGSIDWGPYSLFRWSLLAKICRCKLIFLSVGGGPIYGARSKFFIKKALSLADYRSYRDYTTLEHLRDVGLKVDDDKIYPDLVFSLPNTIVPVDVNTARRPVVGIGIMSYSGRYSVTNPTSATYINYLQCLLSLVKELLLRGYDIKLLIGDAVDIAAKQEFKELLAKQIPEYRIASVADVSVNSAQELLLEIGTTDFVVATRFHNVIMALLCNKPVISISFHHKCASLMRSVGMSDYCLDIHELSDWELIKKFEELENNADKLKRAIGENARAFRKSLDEQYEIIFTERYVGD